MSNKSNVPSHNVKKSSVGKLKTKVQAKIAASVVDSDPDDTPGPSAPIITTQEPSTNPMYPDLNSTDLILAKLDTVIKLLRELDNRVTEIERHLVSGYQKIPSIGAPAVQHARIAPSLANEFA